MPKRIQQKRTKGWRMPKGARSVTRPGKFGNPFVTAKYFDLVVRTAMKHESRQDRKIAICPALCKDGDAERIVDMLDCLEHLRGKDLACFCKPGNACHADTLLRIANE